ncbi:MAG: exodeoxyribonuclease alpha subunit [Frankiales bacterium]|nr:exodeoxyribonuclease alpha subunit [Frankiales bacterium]
MRALRATGLLRVFSDADVLEAADVHVASRLGVLGGERDETVLLAAALAVRGTRQGSVVLRLADVPATVTSEVPVAWPDAAAWEAAVTASPLVATSEAQGGRPLRWQDGGLWLDRYWRQELAVADALLARAATAPDVDDDRLRAALARLWPGTQPHDQRLAAAVCVLSRFAVLAGGPGTGKTTTVARVLAAVREVSDVAPRIALAAPTGKAASRLQEAVHAAGGGLPEAEFLRGLEATTLHRLLGLRRGTTRSWHDAENRLPHDVVVVDEASMVSLSLFARLLSALRPGARLLLVGDPDQLASVEAGAVLADLVAPGGSRTPALHTRLASVVPHDDPGPVETDTPQARVRAGVARLRTVYRYDSGSTIDDLAEAVRLGDPDVVLEVLRSGDPAVVFDELPDDAPVAGAPLAALRELVLEQAATLVQAAAAGDAASALAALDAHRLLCAHREGPRGVEPWTRTVQRWVVEALGVQPRREGRYAGLPLLVTSNDPDNRLYNGDSGVVVDRGDDLVAVFARGSDPYEVPLGRLADVRPLHAMTVHRSQGSQFARVTVLLPPASSPLGTRETLYTAVTRAAQGVRVVGSEDAVRAAVLRPVARATGLRDRLA